MPQVSSAPSHGQLLPSYATQGTFYCRVNQLHLWAPGWDDEDQKKPWDPPRNFLKWLRNSGPVVGCEVRGEWKEMFFVNKLLLIFSKRVEEIGTLYFFYFQNSALWCAKHNWRVDVRFLCRSGETFVSNTQKSWRGF